MADKLAPAPSLSNGTDFCQDLMGNECDPRTQDWLFVRDPWPVMLIVSAYLLIVWRGPKWMEHRKPYSLKSLLVVYNSCLVALSGYLVWEFFATSVLRPRSEFSLTCERMDYSDRPESLRLARACWLYFISKLVELLDTMFFILRKKNNQMTFLHIYHHSAICLLWWSGSNVVGGGEAWFSCMFNCFIHTLMYFYYLVAAMGPQYQKYIWWKKYMTRLQLIQFVAIMVKTSYALYLNCGFPRYHQVLQLLFVISQFVLFMNFYKSTYIKQLKQKFSGSSEEAKHRHQNGVSNGTSHLHVE